MCSENKPPCGLGLELKAQAGSTLRLHGGHAESRQGVCLGSSPSGEGPKVLEQRSGVRRAAVELGDSGDTKLAPSHTVYLPFHISPIHQNNQRAPF